MGRRRLLPAVLLLFVGSGAAALIYEIVWFQLLQLVIGSSAISLGVLLGTFMGGLCLGSLLYPRVVSARHHPLAVYAAMEMAIGIIALIVLLGMPGLGRLYAALSVTGPLSIVVRSVTAGICLLPPTMLMGATLPALSRWVESTPRGVSWLGFFYAGNTTGAVLGSLLAGFYLLRVHDVTIATYAAVAINGLVGLLAWAMAWDRQSTPADAPAAASAPLPPGDRVVYLVTALSGLTGMAAEVIWTRLLSLLFGGTTYTFSLILAAFLAGLGIGSTIGSALARTIARPRIALGWCQALLCVAMAWAGLMLTRSLPYWPIDPSIAESPWINFQVDFVRSLWVVLPAALLWGASFPLALAATASPHRDQARTVGTLYAANTVGAIIGSLGASLLLVAWLGSQHAQQVLIAICAISAIAVLTPLPSVVGWRRTARAVGALLLVIGVGASSAAMLIAPVPGLLVAYGRFTATRSGQGTVLYTGEGLNSSVAVTRLGEGTLSYHNAGKVQASSDPSDMRLQRMLGHLTTLMSERPRSVLVIGCGAGVTAGAVSLDPRLERLTVAEIEPLVVKTVSTYFNQYNARVLQNPKLRVQIDDGRHYLLTSGEKFDAVTADPLDPWVKGAAMLYSKEFFELVRQHLNPGGVVTLFVQLYQSNTDAVKSELATFFDVFPNGVVWANTINDVGYDLVLQGQLEPIRIDLDRLEQRLRSPEYAPIARSLSEIGFNSAIDLLSTYAGHASDLVPWLATAAITRDRNLRLQYLAGLGLNEHQSGVIHNEMLAFRRPPHAHVVGSEELKAWLWDAIQRPQVR